MSLKKLLISVLFSAITATSFATTAIGGLVFDVHGGAAALDTPDNVLFNNTYLGHQKSETGDATYGGSLGLDIAFTDHFILGAELGYNNFGQSKYSGDSNTLGNYKTSIKSQDAELLGKIKYLWSNGLNIYGKGGMAYVYQEQKGSYSNTTFTVPNKNHNDDFEPVAAIGAGFNLTNRIGINGEYKHIFGDSLNANDLVHGSNKIASVDAFTLGLTFTL